MKFDQKYQSKLLNDALGQRFNKTEGLVHCVQNRTGKFNSGIITSY